MSDTDLPILKNKDQLQVILHEPSPWGNLDAVVQHDNRSLYFYLVPRQTLSNFSTKACWVRNLVKGPLVINQDDLLSGRQVMLPRNQTRSIVPEGVAATTSQLPPTADSLQIVWFEDGDGAALIQRLDGDDHSRTSSTAQALAVIPAWSGIKGFHGYAADCASDSPICWPLPNNPRLHARIDRAAQFWDSFRAAPDPFLDLRDRLLQRYDQMLLSNCSPPDDLSPTQPESSSRERESPPEVQKQYYDISNNQFPPRGLIEYRFGPAGSRVVLLTVGMSLCCQPQVELDVEDARQNRRIELAIELLVEGDGCSQSPLESNGSSLEKRGSGRPVNKISGVSPLTHARQELARLAAYPWRNFRWLGAGHTCQFTGVFSNSNSVRLMPQTMITKLPVASTSPTSNPLNELSPGPSESSPADSAGAAVELISFRDDPVTLLWLSNHGQM